MQEFSVEAGETSRIPQTPSTHPFRGQGASAPSGKISAASEPEPLSEAASRVPPVLDDLTQTDRAASVTAIAEPETVVVPEPAVREASGSAMIVFEDVTKVYEPGVTALKGVSFTIEKGEFVFVVGASGSGKSTVVRLLLKEIELTEGRIVVGGRDLGRLKRSKVPLLRRNIGCVFQDFKLLPNRTAAENISYALRVQGQSNAQIRKKVPEVLNLVGLAHKMNSRPEELSGGEQQRVSIARAFVNHPPLLVCDEPTGNLDPDNSVGIMQLLYRISRTGTTILMVTHDREMVDKMRRRVIALEQGRLVRDERRGGYAED
jgi:cell division transport system ATP-binding protein